MHPRMVVARPNPAFLRVMFCVGSFQSGCLSSSLSVVPVGMRNGRCRSRWVSICCFWASWACLRFFLYLLVVIDQAHDRDNSQDEISQSYYNVYGYHLLRLCFLRYF